MKIRNTIYLITAAVFAACTAEDISWQLTPQQEGLIGQGISFSATMADPFVTRTTYHHDGSFNEGDQMRIFRQYANTDGTTFDEDGEIFRTYYYKMNYATGTALSLNNDWLPAYDKLNTQKSDVPGTTSLQTSADSLTWEDGRVVRFRAWGRSNLSGALSASTNTAARDVYYPDYTVSDWVTVSGPTQDIPLTMRHIACRIALVPKNGNEFSSVQLCLDDADYDNNTAVATEVRNAYYRMCMPAGVDDKTFLLTAMTKSLYENDETDFNHLERYTSEDGIVKINTLEANEIAANVQHPEFKNNDGKQYLLTIPFDMSKTNAGETITLPACTRVKVWLYKVGENGKSSRETECHIFELGKILKDDGKTKAFPDGLTLKAGYSYSFSVGYQYNQFSVISTGSFSWTDGPEIADYATLENHTLGNLDFSWWTEAIASAANDAINGNKDFVPSFTISSPQQFYTFIRLVNGTAATKTSGLERGEVRAENGPEGFPTYYWIKDDGNGNTVQMTREQAESDGYVFYPHYHASDVNQSAYVIEDYVTGPVDFYDTDFDLRYKVELANDLDFYDIKIPGIGDAAAGKAFRGYFNGCGNSLKNLYMDGGYLFDYVKDGAITNLKIESTHNTCLLNKAEFSDKTLGWGCYIAGISMLCPSSGSSIATSLKGTSYVVGCIHIGTAGAALVGVADAGYPLSMFGCMQATDNLDETTGALVGNKSVKWGTQMYNYYDTSLSPKATAVAGVADAYDYDDYVRGSKSYVLKAKFDYMLGNDVDKAKLAKEKPNVLNTIYGMAPWNAMNQGISEYNKTTVGKKYPCIMKYSMVGDAYTNSYPTLDK